MTIRDRLVAFRENPVKIDDLLVILIDRETPVDEHEVLALLGCPKSEMLSAVKKLLGEKAQARAEGWAAAVEENVEHRSARLVAEADVRRLERDNVELKRQNDLLRADAEKIRGTVNEYSEGLYALRMRVEALEGEPDVPVDRERLAELADALREAGHRRFALRLDSILEDGE